MMQKKIRIIFTALIAALTMMMTAQAQSDHVAHYQAYNAALEQGDMTTAIDEAEKAWRAAEQELGDNPTTAVLAFNYTQLVFLENPSDALPALLRAEKLVQQEIATLPETDLKLYIAYAEFVISDRGRRETTAYRKALTAAVDPNAETATLGDILLWHRLAGGEVKHQHWRHAAEAAGNAQNILERLEPDNEDLLVRILLIRGVATLMPRPRSPAQIQRAHRFIDRALHIPPPQKDFASFDPVFAQTIAWDEAIHAAITGHPRGGNLDSDSDEPRRIFQNHLANPRYCGLEWEEIIRPEYPSKANLANYIGAVVIVFDVGDTGHALNPRILSEVPGTQFGEASLEAIRKWRIKTRPSHFSGCRVNQLAFFRFYVPQGY